MRKIALAVLLASVACSTGHLPKVARGETVLEIRGSVRDGPFALGRTDLERLPRGAVRGVDPASGRAALWQGLSVASLVTDWLELLKGADTVIARTSDGAAIPIPIPVIRHLRPVLADRADGAPLPSRVLAWPTLEQRGLATDPRAASWWARDVVRLEIVDWQRTFGPALATPDGAPDAARRGSGWFSERCVSCHRLRGVGGERGPDLTTVAARMRPDAFLSLLGNHPGWNGRLGEQPGERGARDVWAFLHAVSVATSGGRAGAMASERPPDGAP